MEGKLDKPDFPESKSPPQKHLSLSNSPPLAWAPTVSIVDITAVYLNSTVTYFRWS